jgi:hypothetical protein
MPVKKSGKEGSRCVTCCALTLYSDPNCFHFDITAQRLKDDPHFDKDHWPTTMDTKWGRYDAQHYNRIILAPQCNSLSKAFATCEYPDMENATSPPNEYARVADARRFRQGHAGRARLGTQRGG